MALINCDAGETLSDAAIDETGDIAKGIVRLYLLMGDIPYSWTASHPNNQLGG